MPGAIGSWGAGKGGSVISCRHLTPARVTVPLPAGDSITCHRTQLDAAAGEVRELQECCISPNRRYVRGDGKGGARAEAQCAVDVTVSMEASEL